jgi:hypothetical protein
MLTGLLLLLDLATAAPGPCAPAAIAARVQAAAPLLGKRDLAGAGVALGSAGSCPATSYPAFVAHVLRGEIAIGAGDWAGARAALADVALHAEVALSARAGFVRLRADQGLNDAAAFARDRTMLVTANDAMLTAAGRRIETFRAGTASITAYEATVDQGPFRRTVEFVVVPDDLAAYPVSILLTDDRTAVAMSAQMATPGEAKREHVWFLDLYTCGQHSTLLPPIATDMPAAYDSLKARVVATLATVSLAAAPPPDHTACWSSAWLLPGLGRQP